MSSTAPEWRTRGEAAMYLRVDPKTIDRYAREGKLTRYYLAGGKAVRYRLDDLVSLAAPAGDEIDDEGNPPAA